VAGYRLAEGGVWIRVPLPSGDAAFGSHGGALLTVAGFLLYDTYGTSLCSTARWRKGLRHGAADISGFSFRSPTRPNESG